MRLLLDTHALLWALADPARLGEEAHGAVRDGRNEVLVSAASVWEIAIKRAAGKLDAPDDLLDVTATAGFLSLPISAQHAFAVAPEDDAGVLYARSAEVAASLLDDVLASPDPTFRDQVGEPTYAHKITADDRRLDLGRPAEELVNRVRALSPHIGARGELHGRGVTIWRARIGDDGSFEPVDMQPDGKGRMTYEAWLRGLRP
jgi:hypothetical protein